MNPDLRTPPPRVWRIFALVYWSLILTVAAFIVLLMALFALLVIAVVLGWLGSLMS